MSINAKAFKSEWKCNDFIAFYLHEIKIVFQYLQNMEKNKQIDYKLMETLNRKNEIYNLG
jgi:hypothetical protein